MKDLGNKNVLTEAVNEIIIEANEVLQNSKNTDYENGQLLAYATALGIIKDTLSGYNLKDYGLDFDIDEKYLTTKK